jgi:DnaJ-class molecular chaperone
MTTFYDVLQVPQNASFDQIKKQYRKLSLEHHPDRGGDAEIFKKINEAYETLSDENNRRGYDQRMNPISAPNIFEMLFSGLGPGGPGFPGGPMHPGIHVFHGNGDMPFPFPFHPPIKPSPLQLSIEISLDQSFTGCSVPIVIERTIENKMHRISHKESETIYLDIPCGIDNNETILILNKGNHMDGLIGDVKIVIIVKNTTKLERRGLDLYYTHTLSLKEALCGFEAEIEYLQNKTFKIINTDYVISPQYKKIIPNMGMKREKNQGQFIINFNIVFPALSIEQVEQLKNIL